MGDLNGSVSSQLPGGGADLLTLLAMQNGGVLAAPPEPGPSTSTTANTPPINPTGPTANTPPIFQPNRGDQSPPYVPPGRGPLVRPLPTKPRGGTANTPPINPTGPTANTPPINPAPNQLTDFSKIDVGTPGQVNPNQNVAPVVDSVLDTAGSNRFLENIPGVRPRRGPRAFRVAPAPRSGLSSSSPPGVTSPGNPTGLAAGTGGGLTPGNGALDSVSAAQPQPGLSNASAVGFQPGGPGGLSNTSAAQPQPGLSNATGGGFQSGGELDSASQGRLIQLLQMLGLS